MANVRIASLPVAATIEDDDVVALDNAGGTSRRATIEQLREAIGGPSAEGVADGHVLTADDEVAVWAPPTVPSPASQPNGRVPTVVDGVAVWADPDTEGLVPEGREIVAGAGLTGGGDLSTNRAIAIDTAGATDGDVLTYSSGGGVPVWQPSGAGGATLQSAYALGAAIEVTGDPVSIGGGAAGHQALAISKENGGSAAPAIGVLTGEDVDGIDVVQAGENPGVGVRVRHSYPIALPDDVVGSGTNRVEVHADRIELSTVENDGETDTETARTVYRANKIHVVTGADPFEIDGNVRITGALTGGGMYGVRVVDTDSALAVTDRVVHMDTSGGPLSCNLPNPAGVEPGLVILFKKITTDTNAITLNPYVSENVEGSGSSLVVPGSAGTSRPTWGMYSDGTDWWMA